MQIHFAARRGDREAVLRQISRGISADARFFQPELDVRYDQFGEDGSTPLMWAAESRQADNLMLELLINNGADVNACSKCLQQTPLHVSAETDQIEKVRFLLDRGANAKFLNGCKSSPLVKYPPASQELIRLLVNYGVDLNQETTHGESIIKIASAWADWQTLRLITELGADEQPLRWTSLMRSIIFGTQNDIAQQLSDAFFHTTDCWGRTAWLLALCSGDLEKVKLLKHANADIELDPHHPAGQLECAVLGANIDTLEYLLDNGININASDGYGKTALMCAVERDLFEVATHLIKRGSDVNMQDHVQTTALHFANNEATIKLLVNAGADVNRISGCGDWPLRKAASSGDLQLVNALLAMGANVDNTSTGETALHAAVQGDNLSVMKVLMEAGADVNVQTVDGCGLLWYVRSAEAAKILKGSFIDLFLEDEKGKRAYEYHEDSELRELVRPR